MTSKNLDVELREAELRRWGKRKMRQREYTEGRNLRGDYRQPDTGGVINLADNEWQKAISLPGVVASQ